MDDEVVQVAVDLRLGLPLGHSHSCASCGSEVDKSGTHGLSCISAKDGTPDMQLSMISFNEHWTQLRSQAILIHWVSTVPRWEKARWGNRRAMEVWEGARMGRYLYRHSGPLTSDTGSTSTSGSGGRH